MQEATPAAEAEAAVEAGPRQHDESIVDVLAAKIFVDWLRNRQQLLVPLAIDMQNLEPALAETVVHAMVAAAQAGGTRDANERERVQAGLRTLRANEEHQALVSAAIDAPKSLAEVLASVSDVRTGALIYAATLLVVDRRKLVDRQYLRYLAARLQLPRDTARSLEQRFRPTT
jgi:uncharacterized membrane protein YebE (DUF533 family)